MNKKILTCVLSSSLLLTPTILFADERGIDVSEWQGTINYREVKAAGIENVYIKASEGFDYKDPYYQINYANAKASDLKVGFYHYLTASSVEEAIEQADFFVSCISGYSIDIKLALDYEEFYDLDKDTISEIALAFLNRVVNKTGKECVLYADASSANSLFNEDIATYGIWVADWGVTSPYLNSPWTNYNAWQYSDAGRINGINTNVDLDQFSDTIFLNDTSIIPTHSYTPTTSNKYIYVRVESGDTLSALALRFKTSVDTLVSINGIINPNLIYTGQIIRIPK